MSDAFHEHCPARMVFNHITSRWGALVLTGLRDGPLCFSELRVKIQGISEKMLSQTLRTLVNDGLVARSVEPSSPPKVSYRLTELGESLSEHLRRLFDWTRTHAAAVLAAQRQAKP